MEIICRDRQTGKTTELIKRAKDYNGYIICTTMEEMKRIMLMARKLKLNINQPITFHEFLKHEYYGSGIKKFHIDEADRLLQQLTTVPIETITMTIEMDEKKISLKEAFLYAIKFVTIATIIGILIVSVAIAIITAPGVLKFIVIYMVLILGMTIFFGVCDYGK